MLNETTTTSQHGNTTVQNTETSTSYENASVHERATAEDHEPELAVGQLITDIKPNAALAKRFGIKAKASPALVTANGAPQPKASNAK